MKSKSADSFSARINSFPPLSLSLSLSHAHRDFAGWLRSIIPRGVVTSSRSWARETRCRNVSTCASQKADLPRRWKDSSAPLPFSLFLFSPSFSLLLLYYCHLLVNQIAEGVFSRLIFLGAKGDRIGGRVRSSTRQRITACIARKRKVQVMHSQNTIKL